MNHSASMTPVIHGNVIRTIRRQSLNESLAGFAARVGVDAGQL